MGMRQNKTISPLAVQLLFSFIAVSLAFIVLSSSVQLALEIHRDVQSIEDGFDLIETSYIPAVASSYFYLNTQQLQLLLDGIELLPDMHYAALYDGSYTEAPMYHSGSPRDGMVESRRFELIYEYQGQERYLGYLIVQANTEDVKIRTVSRIEVIVLTNMVTGVFLSLFLLFRFHRIVVRDLQSIAAYLRGIDLDSIHGDELQIEQHSSRPNELSEIISAIQAMQQRIIRDFQQQKQIQQELRQTISAKEMLQRELFHRTKNSMQMILSLLNIHSQEHRDNPGVQQIVRDTSERIYAMSLVHQMLYLSDDVTRIGINEYFSTLIGHFIDGAKVDGRTITSHLHIQEIELSIDTALPLGLVTVELISNSIKHAFNDSSEGEFWLSIRREGEHLRYEYRDSGRGTEEPIHSETSNSFGMTIVRSIVESQMGGQLSFPKDDGFRLTASIPHNPGVSPPRS